MRLYTHLSVPSQDISKLPKSFDFYRPEPNPFILREMARIFFQAYFTVFTGGSKLWNYLPSTEDLSKEEAYTWTPTYAEKIDAVLNRSKTYREDLRFVLASMEILSLQSDSENLVVLLLDYLGQDELPHGEAFLNRQLRTPILVFLQAAAAAMRRGEQSAEVNVVLHWIEEVLFKVDPNPAAKTFFKEVKSAANKRDRERLALMKQLENLGFSASVRDTQRPALAPRVLFTYPPKPEPKKVKSRIKPLLSWKEPAQ